MAASTEAMSQSLFASEGHPGGLHKTIPILPSSAAASSMSPAADAMEVTPQPTPMGPPLTSSPGADRNGAQTLQPVVEPDSTNGNPASVIGAAAAAQQPKVVQTAFIHKLYNMLEDQSIQHLISWSNTNESFVMSPSSEFSKVLSSYFKHTNISSFVRQLNMYGFHKVSDVFQTGSPDSPLWEFKHGNNNFKRGDLVGLREIKRRASRHALIHRDSFSTGPKGAQSQPVTPVEAMPDPVEARLANLEHAMYEAHARLARSEDAYAFLSSRYQMLMEGVTRCYQWNQELAGCLMALRPDPENQIHKDAVILQREITRHLDMLRVIDDPHDTLSARNPFYSNPPAENAPLSPRQTPQDEQRRSSLLGNSRSIGLRAPMPAHLTTSPRRYGSIGTGNYSPSTRSHLPLPPPHPSQMPPALSSFASPPVNLSRRHTSADIRLHGWENSPFASGNSSTHWPSSPHRAPVAAGDQQIRDALAQYELPRGPRTQGSRQATPPLTCDTTPSNLSADSSSWSLPGARYQFKPMDTPGPQTRRSSMASNVHSLLNPAETAERTDEDGGPLDDRKRKRMQ